jgi:hypothetical protein
MLAARVVGLLVALAALGWALRLGARRDSDDGAPARGDYVCPMHPEARAPAPGACAICGMARRPPRPAEAALPDEVVGTPLELTAVREVRAPAWRDGADRVAALLFADEVALLAPGQTAQLRLGRRSLEVRRDDTPPRRWDDATFSTSWRLVDRALGADGAVGALELPRRTQLVRVVPYAAVIASPAGPYVLVVDGHAPSPRPIVTGRTLFDFVTVLGGVGAKERLIVRDAYAYDRQRRLTTEAP